MSESTCRGKVCPHLSKPIVVPEHGVKLHEVICIEHRCAHYQQMNGKHPQDGSPLGFWDCAFNWMNILTIENTKAVQQTDDEISRFRQEHSVADVPVRSLRSILRLPTRRQ